MSLRLSFIVPFYNVEPYIEECIRSLYNQDIPLEEYEVICVDDCSPDGSRAIVEQLQKEYPTLRLFTTPENLRQGGARNMGLDVAQGKYIWFVDSDDYIEPNCLNKLLSQTEDGHLDILQFNYQDENKLVRLVQSGNLNAILTGENYLFNDHTLNWVERVCGPWCQIYNKSFLIDNAFAFVQNVQYEDTDYVLKTFLAANRVQYVDISSYFYRTNGDSTTHLYLSPLKLAWKVNQLVRCYQLTYMAHSLIAKQKIQKMVYNSLSQLRMNICPFSIFEKIEYINHLSKSIYECRRLMSWRTWLALRFGITWFI